MFMRRLFSLACLTSTDTFHQVTANAELEVASCRRLERIEAMKETSQMLYSKLSVSEDCQKSR